MEDITINNAPYIRMLWPELVEPSEMDGKKRYGILAMLPVDDRALESLPGLTPDQKKTVLKKAADFKALVLAAAKKECPKVKAEDIFTDGDEYADAATEEYKSKKPEAKDLPEYLDSTRGFVTFRAKTQYKPAVYGPKAAEGVKPDEWTLENMYGGAWVRAALRGYAWTYMKKSGFSIGLGSQIQKWADATKLGKGAADSAPPEDAMEVEQPVASADDFLD